MFRIRKPVEDVFYITVEHNGKASWYRSGKHQGIDLRTRCKAHPDGIGTPIYAVADGVWKSAEYNRMMGNTVTLIHGEYQTVYGHLSKTNFIPGYSKVKAGDIVGYSGESGLMCFGPHLHFEVLRGGVSLDPELFIKAGEDLVNWSRSRAVMKVEGKGDIQFFIKGGFVNITEENCWKIISKNTWGISNKDYKDLLNLI